MAESAQAIPPFVNARQSVGPRVTPRPTAREWVLHASLFLVTIVTTTIAGLIFAAPETDVASPPLTKRDRLSVIRSGILSSPRFRTA